MSLKASTATRRTALRERLFEHAPGRRDGVARGAGVGRRLVAARALADVAPRRSSASTATSWRSPRRCRSRGSRTTAPGACGSGAAGRARGRARVARRLLDDAALALARGARWRARRRSSWRRWPASTTSEAWRMRTAVAADCKEALDSIVALDGPEAWALRETHADVWPSTVGQVAGPARRRRARRGADRAPARRARRTTCRCSNTPPRWRWACTGSDARSREIETSDHRRVRCPRQAEVDSQRTPGRRRRRGLPRRRDALGCGDDGSGRARSLPGCPAAAGAMLPWKTGNTWTVPGQRRRRREHEGDHRRRRWSRWGGPGRTRTSWRSRS